MNMNGNPTISPEKAPVLKTLRFLAISYQKEHWIARPETRRCPLIERFVGYCETTHCLLWGMFFFSFFFLRVAYISCPGLRRYREQYCQRIHKARWHQSGPFPAGNQFLGESGLQVRHLYLPKNQGIWRSFRIFSSTSETRPAALLISTPTSDAPLTVPSFNTFRSWERRSRHISKYVHPLALVVLLFISSYRATRMFKTSKFAASVAKEQEQSTKLVGELANAVSTYQNTPMQIQAKDDPYAIWFLFAYLLLNLSQIPCRLGSRLPAQTPKSSTKISSTSPLLWCNKTHFEGGIVRVLQFDEWKSRASVSSQEIFSSLSLLFLPIASGSSSPLAQTTTTTPKHPLATPNLSTTPQRQPLRYPRPHRLLKRKKRLICTYTEGYFVVTPAGFLHEFSSSDPTLRAGEIPSQSLFLPECTLSPASHTRAHVNKFHIECNPDGQGTIKTGSFGGSFVCRGHQGVEFLWKEPRR